MTDIAVRAWKDPDYRNALNADLLQSLPDHPAGATWKSLDRERLLTMVGGKSLELAPITREYTCTWCVPTFGKCPPPP